MQDAGVYQAKVVSSAGECYSSCISMEVEPGFPKPELSARMDHYGAWMATAPPENAQEVKESWPKYGLINPWGHGMGMQLNPQKASGWIEGLVGSWEVRHSWKERFTREKGGYFAKLHDNEKRNMFNWIIKRPYSESPGRFRDCWDESELLFTPSDEVRHALIRIWVEQDRELQVHLEWNEEALIKHLNEEEDWPDQPLLRSREKMPTGTSLNHTRDTIMEWELKQADTWFDSFVEDPVSNLRWPGFRVQKIKSNLQNCTTETSSSPESSSSEEEKGGRMKHIDWNKEPMSVRVGDEEQGDESSEEEEEEEEDATSS